MSELKKTLGNHKKFVVSKNVGDFMKLFANYKKSQSGNTCREEKSYSWFSKKLLCIQNIFVNLEKNVHEILENIQKNQMSFAKFKIHPPILKSHELKKC